MIIDARSGSSQFAMKTEPKKFRPHDKVHEIFRVRG